MNDLQTIIRIPLDDGTKPIKKITKSLTKTKIYIAVLTTCLVLYFVTLFFSFMFKPNYIEYYDELYTIVENDDSITFHINDSIVHGYTINEYDDIDSEGSYVAYVELYSSDIHTYLFNSQIETFTISKTNDENNTLSKVLHNNNYGELSTLIWGKETMNKGSVLLPRLVHNYYFIFAVLLSIIGLIAALISKKFTKQSKVPVYLLKLSSFPISIAISLMLVTSLQATYSLSHDLLTTILISIPMILGLCLTIDFFNNLLRKKV